MFSKSRNKSNQIRKVHSNRKKLKARKFARSLKLKSFTEWRKYSKGLLIGKPKIPVWLTTKPDDLYTRTNDWTDWYDFLGNKRPKSK